MPILAIVVYLFVSLAMPTLSIVLPLIGGWIVLSGVHMLVWRSIATPLQQQIAMLRASSEISKMQFVSWLIPQGNEVCQGKLSEYEKSLNQFVAVNAVVFGLLYTLVLVLVVSQ